MNRFVLIALLGCAAASPVSGRGHVVTSIPGSDGIWDYASYDPHTRRILVAHGDSIGFVDLAAPTAVETLAPARHSHQVLALPGSHELLVTEGDTGSAQIIDGRTGAVRANIALGEKPDAAIWDGRRNRAIVMNNRSGTISVVDVQSAKVTATIGMARGLEYAAFGPDGLLYVNNEKTNEIGIVDLDRAKVLGTFALAGCEAPTGMAYAPKAKRIVSSCDGVATIFDPVTRRVTGTIAIGGGPDAVIGDPARDRLYIPSGDTGTMTVLSDSAAGLKRVESIPTAKGARTGAVDPHSGFVYLPVADFGSAAPGVKPTQTPGTFRVLVVDPE